MPVKKRGLNSGDLAAQDKTTCTLAPLPTTPAKERKLSKGQDQTSNQTLAVTHPVQPARSPHSCSHTYTLAVGGSPPGAQPCSAEETKHWPVLTGRDPCFRADRCQKRIDGSHPEDDVYRKILLAGILPRFILDSATQGHSYGCAGAKCSLSDNEGNVAGEEERERVGGGAWRNTSEDETRRDRRRRRGEREEVRETRSGDSDRERAHSWDRRRGGRSIDPAQRAGSRFTASAGNTVSIGCWMQCEDLLRFNKLLETKNERTPPSTVIREGPSRGTDDRACGISLTPEPETFTPPYLPLLGLTDGPGPRRSFRGRFLDPSQNPLSTGRVYNPPDKHDHPAGQRRAQLAPELRGPIYSDAKPTSRWSRPPLTFSEVSNVFFREHDFSEELAPSLADHLDARVDRRLKSGDCAPNDLSVMAMDPSQGCVLEALIGSRPIIPRERESI
ncbi:unnamed protein product [Pleuronectes platessa]|uniref:Uncharacterized protein n=1 Tax=Pleuronectes platessa TaxID=8262 RepID=A0A9N7YQ43_PLEPL|nr:unnamed protein product [Pleuronectes platessa]